MSVNLPLEEVSATAYAAATLAGVGAESQTVIGVLINSGAAWAAAAMTAGVPEWRAAITGQASIADHFAATVRQYLDAAEVEDGFADVAYANFGVYGEFTFVVVHLSDALVFMDPLTGNLLGPLEPGSALEAPPLLIEHPDAYEEGMGVRYYNAPGCVVIAGPGWKTSPPCWLCTPTIVPDPPGPGGQTYFCVDYGIGANGAIACVCFTSGTTTIGLTTYRTRCVITCGPAGSCIGGGWAAGTPPAWCPGTCVTQYWY